MGRRIHMLRLNVIVATALYILCTASVFAITREQQRPVKAVAIGAGCQKSRSSLLPAAAAPGRAYPYPLSEHDDASANTSFEVKHDGAQPLVFHFAYLNLEPSTVITITNQQADDDPASEPEQQIYDRRSMGSSRRDFFPPCTLDTLSSSTRQKEQIVT